MLAVARILQGLGGGGLMTLSQALIGETVPPRERARYQGYLAGVMVTSSTFGPVAGGLLTHYFGWRSVFLVNLPLGLIAVLLTFRLEPRAVRDQPWTFDAPGLALFVAFIAPLLLALDQVQRMGARTLPLFLAMIGVSAAALLALVFREKRRHLSAAADASPAASRPSGAATRSPPATAPCWFRSSPSCPSTCACCAAPRPTRRASCCCP